MLKSLSSKAAASEEARRYVPHFVWAVRPCNGSLRTEKPPKVLPTSEKLLFNVEPLNEARTPLADFFSILLRGGRELLRQEWHVFLLKGEMDDQEDDSHADRRVGDIERRPMVGAHIDIEKIDHLAIP